MLRPVMGATTPWFIVHSEASLGWGGQEMRVISELTGFRDRGARVALIAPPHSKIFRHAEGLGIETVPLDLRKPRFVQSVLQVAGWLRRNNVQIVNPHSSRDGWIVGIAARLARVPLLIRSRHFDVPSPNRFVSRHAYRTFADYVITTSEAIAEKFRVWYGIPAANISAIPTGVDVERFSPEGPKADLSFVKGPQGAPVIGMVSVIRTAKGHQYLLEAAEQLRAAKFAARYLIVGEGPMLPWLEKELAARQLEDCFTLAGFRDDVPEILRSLDLLLMPSLHEGVPQVGMQALACGTPFIGSRIGGLPQIIREGETGRTFPPADGTAIKETILKVFQEPEATRRMAEAGRRMICEEFSVTTMLDKVEAIYRTHLPPSLRGLGRATRETPDA